jgi:hypothetical protein
MDFASGAGCESAKLAIGCLSAPRDLAHENDEFRVEDRVNDAVVPHPHSIEVLFQMNARPRLWLIAKRAHSLDYTLSIIGGHPFQLFLNVSVEFEGVGHV